MEHEGVKTRSMTKKEQEALKHEKMALTKLHRRMMTRSMTKEEADAYRKMRSDCPFLFETAELLSLEGLHRKIFCIPDRKQRPMYYALDELTGQLKFLGNETILEKCTQIDPERRELMVQKCLDRDVIAKFTDDTQEIRKFLVYFEEKGGIEPCILDFLEQLSLFTTMTFDNFIQILGGAYTVLKGDKGRLYNKFKECKQKKYSIIVPIFQKDIVPMSSHDRYMKDAFRMGAGVLTKCDKEGQWCKENPETNSAFDILIGRSKVKKYKNDTCFQFEDVRMDTLENFLWHGWVFAKYMWFRQNVGAFGYSRYRDSAPLVIEACNHVCPRFISSTEEA